jgi:hypothetical protein
MFCRPTLLRLLHVITANIQVNKGSEYFPRGRHIGQLWSKSKHEDDLNVNCSLRMFITVIRTKNTFVEVKVKVKFTLQQATKAQRGSKGTTPLFL